MAARRALVIGGSLGGLLAANLLRDTGWDVTVFERKFPGHRRLGCVRRADGGESINGAQRSELLDRLVRRAVLTQPD